MMEERAKPKLRLGLLLDNTLVSKYVMEFVRWSLTHELLEISDVLVVPPAESRGAPFQNDGRQSTTEDVPALSRVFFGLIVTIERLFLLKNKDHHDHLQKFDLSQYLPAALIRHWHDNATTLPKVRDLDLLVAFSPSIKSVDTLPKLGTIAVSHSDDHLYRGGPAGFWEVYSRNDVTGFTIQHWTGDANTAETIWRGRVGTQFYYLLNQASLFKKSTYYLTRMVERLATTGPLLSVEPKLPFCYQPTDIPRSHQSLGYLAGLVRLTISKLLQKSGAGYRWGVAFVHADWRNAELWRADTIENPSGHYLADPFVIRKAEKDFCFVEDYDIELKRGRITVYELGTASATYLGVALDESFHLSYPYLFEYQDELYMCPETSETREIRIYKCLDFPLRWRFEKAIMKGVSAVDTMLFEHHGKWWMLTNIDPARWNDFTLELCLFSASSPLDEEWVPHPGNPFVIDASRTRNGGMVKEGDRLFRVAQGQGFDMYGKRTSINEIVELTETIYVENCVGVISPTFRPGISCTHHLHSNGHVTVVDFATRL